MLGLAFDITVGLKKTPFQGGTDVTYSLIGYSFDNKSSSTHLVFRIPLQETPLKSLHFGLFTLVFTLLFAT